MAELDLYGDTDTHERQARRKHRLLMLVILVMAVVVAPAAIRIFGQIEHQLQKTGVAASDNRTWVIAQLEVDLTKLLLAVAQARGAEEPATMLDELRLQFDVLYSRVLLLKTSAILQGIGLESLDEWHYLSGEGGLLDRLVPLFDGSDEGLVAALPTLAAEFGALQPPIRVAVVEAVNEVMKDDDLLRRELRDLLRWFAGAMLWILSGMAILMAVLFLQSRSRTKQARDLEIALQNLRTTITAALDAVMIINAQERVVAANRATTSLFGGAVACLRPKLSDILRRPDSGPVTRAELLPGARVRMQGVRLDGTLFPAEVSIGSGQTAGGRAITVVFLRDISEQIAHEESLAQARNAAMEADEAKARFLAVMSHEMRTPLTGLLSAVDLLERTTKLDQTQAWLTDTIRTCGGIALEQVNNVLHLSRMNDASAGDYPVTAFPIARAVKDIARSFDSDAARNGTVIELAGLEGEDIGVLLPLQVLRRSLGNLLSNAVKFTDEGLIRVELSHAPAERAGWVALRISVQDTGIGIDRKDLDRIFRNFETLDSSYSRVREGSGLGLGIAKLAVEQMGGHIETESEVGRGSRFTIFIEAPLAPLPVAAVEEDAAIPERPLGGVSLLLAEDNPINRTLMARQLESLGAQVTTAVDGQDAVEKARGSLFDVILMDVAMPHVDGLDATRMIRAEGACRPVPIVAVTAHAEPERLELFHAAGMNGMLTKPVRIGELVDMILDLARRADAIGESPVTRRSEVPVALRLADEPHLAVMMEDLGRDFVSSIVDTFRAETDKSLETARLALAKENLDALRASSHSVAGAAAALGLVALNRVLRDQELAATEGDAASALRLQAEVERLYTDSVAELDRILAAA